MKKLCRWCGCPKGSHIFIKKTVLKIKTKAGKWASFNIYLKGCRCGKCGNYGNPEGITAGYGKGDGIQPWPERDLGIAIIG